MSLRVDFRSLGCKLNQLETESLADAFRRAGWSVSGGGEEAVTVPGGADRVTVPADLVVVNTCTVTSKAEQKARHIARAALKAGPEAVVLLTGCYAQVEGEGLAALDSRALVLPGEAKAALLGLPDWLADNWQGHGDLAAALREWLAGPNALSDDRFAFRPERFAFHSRPSLKIQDGCDNRCAYCRVCIARGQSLSLAPEEVLARSRELEASGAAEIVLAGVNLSQYRSGGLRFPGLLRLLLEGTSRVAFRISSFEPDGIDAEFLEAFAHPRVRPHAHLPVQSGADAVLARMARPYRRARVLEAVEALRRVKGDPFIACDIIAGFPGETEEDFAATMDLARRCGFAWIHAFPFSARPGTRAWELRPKVPERVAGERVEALTALARAGKAAYAGRWVGREVEAVVEGSEGGIRGTSDNYLKLRIEAEDDCPRPQPGSRVTCRILEALSGASEDAAALIRR